MKTQKALLAVLVVACASLVSAPARAAVILKDLNSEAHINLGAVGQDPAGMIHWYVDGVDHLMGQWFWYRVGSTGPEESLDTLALEDHRASDGNLETGDERLVARYGGPGFTVTVDYILTGGPWGTGASDIAEVIAIQNTGASRLDFHFFQYVDFDLWGDERDESAEIRGGNTAVQTDRDSALSETVVTWVPDRYEVADDGSTLAKLTNAGPDDLSNSAGPLTDGNLTWAFQWDVDLEPGGAFIISKDKNLVPEPTSLVVLALGSLMLALRRRR